MKKRYRIFHQNKHQPIYLIVPGFIGNYEESFIKKIYDFLIKEKFNVYGIEFKGHSQNEKKLANPNEMAKHLKNEYLKIKKKYPLRKIIILAHSQGCAITLKAHYFFKKSTPLILMAPAIFLDEIILPRIKKEDIKLIKSGKPTLCKVSQSNFKVLDKKWVSAYEKFSLENNLSKIKQHCLIVRPSNDFTDKKNASVLVKKIPQNSYIEMDTNHWFDSSPKDIEELAKKFQE